jgi:hypothetical protein
MVSAVFEVADFEEAVELCHRKGWTDGLPVIPPTRALVSRFIDAAGLAADHQIGFYELRNRPVTVEKLAINAAMAGCRPEYFPTVLALSECLLDPALEVHTANSSTGSLSLGFIVNGPVRLALDMNCHGNVLGPGNRANASIGRALRLIQLNVFGSVPGAGGVGQGGRSILDRATMGSPLRYASFHIVENEEAFPELAPLHVMRGFDAQDSVVTAFALASHLMLSNHFEKTPGDWVETVAHYIVGAGRLADGGFGVLLLPPEAAQMFVASGWSKVDISRALYERGRRSVEWVKRNGWKIGGRFERGGNVEAGDADKILSVAGSPEEIYIVICGGPAGNFPVYVQTYAANFMAVSRRIQPLASPTRDDEADAIRRSIEIVRTQLRTDGYDIELSAVDSNRLTFTLVAGSDACADCLVPATIMEQYVRRALSSIPRWREAEIDLRYPGVH